MWDNNVFHRCNLSVTLLFPHLVSRSHLPDKQALSLQHYHWSRLKSRYWLLHTLPLNEINRNESWTVAEIVHFIEAGLRLPVQI